MKENQQYWTNRYKENKTGWDIGYVARPIKEYADQLTNNALKILIPGAGNGYEAEYLWKQGFDNVHILDISEVPLKQFKERNPDFPNTHIHQANFFEFKDQFDLILEQTFFCSFVPTDENRNRYAKHMSELLKPTGKLVGVWFDFPLTDNMEKRPFGGDKELYVSYLSPYFKAITFERCHNSIPPRQNNELFGIFEKQ
ncbi:methyltransferase domain-containing protein [Maribacter sp. ACAM166]|uniref:methyltransferase domain-containing protein n=1 Tax=Maribacter sp. ACAM166 TaxID=2508996 RepID=UPI0010FEA2FF|nr:methyltransferase domain-containing protein [Maribacter sp. ACAM166]TLP80228.1 methyltransferase domain-containing protein [Maribacter sp. ACAM166]